MNVYGYCRVSSPDQDLTIQKQEILEYVKYRGYTLVKLFEDKASGKNTDRPGYGRMMESLQRNPESIDAVVITKLDRMGRSVSDLIRIMDFLQKNDIGLIVLGNNIDTTTKEGRLHFHMMSALAEYERELINERTSAGRIAAMQRGVKFGPKPKKLPMAEIMAKINIGVTKAKICRDYRIHRTTLNVKIREYEKKQERLAIQKELEKQALAIATTAGMTHIEDEDNE